jgi:hypothetical protein
LKDGLKLSLEKGGNVMRKVILIAVFAAVTLAFTGISVFAEEAPKEVHELANTRLSNLGKSMLIVEAVKAQNAKGISLDTIKEIDEKWKNTAGIDDFMKTLMDSGCGPNLQRIQKENAYFAEIFVMYNQGANVCQTDKTSDYWQGDEDKFVKSFNGGKGAIFVDDVEFDDSTQSYISQVSVPVMDGAKAIGAITFGIDVDKLN